MSSTALLSVIIPAFNAEMTLENAVESAVCQGDKGLEVVIVDDGSEDGTNAVAKDLAVRWENVSYIRTRNLGVSHARNKGLEIAKGKWLLFVDADDELKPNIYAALCDLMHHTEFDIIFGMKEYLSPDKKSCFIHKELSEIGDQLTPVSCVDVLESLLTNTEDSLSGSCTRALYRREWLIANNIRFPEGIKLGEDKCYLMECIGAYPRIGRVGLLLYRANQNLASVTRGYISDLESSIRYMCRCTECAAEKFQGLRYLVEPNMAQCAWLLIDNSAKKSLKQSIRTSKDVFSSKRMCSAIKCSESTDQKVARRMSLLRLGLIVSWLPAAALRCKRRLEGY